MMTEDEFEDYLQNTEMTIGGMYYDCKIAAQ